MSARIVIVLVGAVLVGAVALATVAQTADKRRGANPAPAATSSGAKAAVKPLPAPKGEVVLRVTGVKGGNAGARTTKADLASLDRIARETVTVFEPFVKRDVKFTGVRMGDLLASAGVPSSAERVNLHALDDYHVELAVADIASDGLLATRADGKPIPLAEGGPIRLVFTGSSEVARITDNWIWSLDSIRVLG